MPETNGDVNERKSLIRLLSCKSKRSSSKRSLRQFEVEICYHELSNRTFVSMNCKCQWSNGGLSSQKIGLISYLST